MHEAERRVTVADLEVLSNFTNKTLEWELANEELRRFLITPNFTKSDGTGAEPVRFLDTSGGSLIKRKIIIFFQ